MDTIVFPYMFCTIYSSQKQDLEYHFSGLTLFSASQIIFYLQQFNFPTHLAVIFFKFFTQVTITQTQLGLHRVACHMNILE